MADLQVPKHRIFCGDTPSSGDLHPAMALLFRGKMPTAEDLTNMNHRIVGPQFGYCQSQDSGVESLLQAYAFFGSLDPNAVATYENSGGQSVTVKASALREKLVPLLTAVHENRMSSKDQKELLELSVQIGEFLGKTLAQIPFERKSPTEEIADGAALRASGKSLYGNRIALAKLCRRVAVVSKFMAANSGDTRYDKSIETIEKTAVEERFKGEYPGCNFRAYTEREAAREWEMARTNGCPEPQFFKMYVTTDGKTHFQPLRYDPSQGSFVADGESQDRAKFNTYVWKRRQKDDETGGIIV
ncbi:MAG: hypothetical protein LBF24_03735 [Puniceicoccales bacterium]|jgi:hypothetical protein|nr:hypothetical protein [Puniceicoccales bacterium]